MQRFVIALRDRSLVPYVRYIPLALSEVLSSLVQRFRYEHLGTVVWSHVRYIPLASEVLSSLLLSAKLKPRILLLCCPSGLLCPACAQRTKPVDHLQKPRASLPEHGSQRLIDHLPSAFPLTLGIRTFIMAPLSLAVGFSIPISDRTALITSRICYSYLPAQTFINSHPGGPRPDSHGPPAPSRTSPGSALISFLTTAFSSSSVKSSC